MTSDTSVRTLDAIDWEIVRMLTEDPRCPYSDIANQLEKRGHELSSEAVRHRVNNIFEVMSIFFMIHPNKQEWEVMVLLINTVSEKGSKETIINSLLEGKCWFASQGYGSFDVYAITTAETNSDIENIIDDIESHAQVERLEYLVETRRVLESSNYFPLRKL
jgi:DNA-binding Lrp family transcriptional regulator